MKGLFHSDWLGASPVASPIGPQLGEEEMGKSGNPLTIVVSCGWIWQVFLTVLSENCHVTHPFPFSGMLAPLFNRSRTNYFELFISLLCVTYLSKMIQNFDMGLGVLSHILSAGSHVLRSLPGIWLMKKYLIDKLMNFNLIIWMKLLYTTEFWFFLPLK